MPEKVTVRVDVFIIRDDGTKGVTVERSTYGKEGVTVASVADLALRAARKQVAKLVAEDA